MEIEQMIEGLYDKDPNIAYKQLQKLEEISKESNKVYEYIDEFLQMLNSDKGYVRIRGYRLISKNAKWDKTNIIDQNIETILSQLEDKKPIVVRQCIQATKDLVIHKKELKNNIKDKLLSINYLKFNNTMQSLIVKDVQSMLDLIEKS